MAASWQPRRSLFAILLALAQVACVAQPAVTGAPPYDPEARLAELGIKLPVSSPPVANYLPAVRSGNWLFLSGLGPCGEMAPDMLGKLGAERSVEEGYRAARRTAVCLIAVLKAEAGDLKKVHRIVRVFGMVNATPDFTQHPQVINGASDLLVAVFGERGRHARAAVGMASLPFDIPVEIEMMVELEP